MKSLSTRAFLALCIFLAACATGFASGEFENGARVHGSGNVTSEDRDVGAFTAVDLEGSGNVTIRQGGSRALSVETDDNILPFVKTEVVGGVLHLGFKPDTRISGMTRLEFTVASPEITGITLSGSGSMRSAAAIQASSLTLDLRGSGTIACDVDTDSLKADVAGSGSVTVQGRADRAAVTINGSGNVRARGLQSAFADVRISGSGSAVVTVSNTLNVDISGSGSVSYGGAGKATVHASGSGSVSQY